MVTTDINLAIKSLVNNEVIAIPTETVYGLAGNAFSDVAVEKIFKLKNRPFYNPLIVHIPSIRSLNSVACEIPEMAIKLAERFWPGPLTLVLKKNKDISDLITAGKETVAVRVPKHPLLTELLERIDFPLAAPSANPFGSISPTNASHVHNYFKNQLDVILDGGDCERGVESTIIAFDDNHPVLLRHGSVTLEEIEKVVGKLKVLVHNDSNPNAPGMLSRHYAPTTPTYLTDNVIETINTFAGKKIGLLLFKDKLDFAENIYQEVLSVEGDLKEATKNLYASLHVLDQKGCDVIIAEKFPESGLGKTLNDRLKRATKK